MCVCVCQGGTERAWCPGGIVAGAEWGQSGRRGLEGSGGSQVGVRRKGREGKSSVPTWSPTPGSLCLRYTLPPSPTQTVAVRLHLPGCLFLLGGCPFQKGCLSSQCASYWSSLGQACGYVSSARWTRPEVFFSICRPSLVARGREGGARSGIRGK